MCICEFCNTEFQPRPQVKNPRACNKDSCQKLRQTSNEREWRKSNEHLDSKEYHQIRRKQRNEKINKLFLAIIKSLSIGVNFIGLPFNIHSFSDFFKDIFLQLGLRKLNKFWDVNLLYDFDQLDLNT